MFAALGIAFCIGLTLVGVGLRGRRTDDHPLCRRCRFDLTGRATDSTRCPECGADLRGSAAATVGHRRRRRGPLAVGVAVLAFAGTVSAVAVVGAVAGVNWLAHAPVGYLLWQATAANPARGAPAVEELAARLADGRVGGAVAWDRVTTVGVAFQADAARPWNPAWGDLLEAAEAGGHLTDAQWRVYLTHAAVGAYQSVRVRARVRRGDPVPYSVDGQPGRVGHSRWLVVGRRHLRLQWDDRTSAPRDDHNNNLQLLARHKGFNDACEAVAVPADLSPGVHTIHVLADLTVGTLTGCGPVRADVPVGTMDLPGTFTLLPADQPSVRMVHDPAAAPAIRRAITVGLSRAGGYVELYVDGSPVGLGFDVFAGADGRKTKLASFATPASSGNGPYRGQFCLPGPVLTTAAATDVVLRANPAVAAATVDTFDVWDGEIVYKGVPIK